jgi:hypothetical protein
VNRKDIAAIEKSVGAKLPRAYVQFLLDYPQSLADAFPKDRAADERELFGSAKPIIAMNKLVRRPTHLIDPDDPNSTWPKQYLIIGMDIGSNFYCVKLGSVRTAVYFWFHETNEFEKYAKNLREFADMLIEKHGD